VQLGMTVEILLSLETLSTYLAFELLHFGLVLVMLVKVQGAFAGVRRAAYIAHAGFGVVILHVRGVVGLDLEHLAALLATVIVVFGVLADVVYLQIGLCTRFEVAQFARVQLRRLVVDLHVPGEIRAGLEALGADCTFVRPRVTMLKHMTSEFTLTVERDVADFADVRLFFQTCRVLAGARFP